MNQSNKSKYVVLEHKTLPDRGFRFWSLNGGEINTEIYSIVGYTDSDVEAIKLSLKTNYSIVPTIEEMEDHWRDEVKKVFND